MLKHIFQSLVKRDESRIAVNETLKRKVAREMGISTETSANTTGKRLPWRRTIARPAMGLVLMVISFVIIVKTPAGDSIRSSMQAIGVPIDDWQYSGSIGEDELALVALQESGISAIAKPAGQSTGLFGGLFERASDLIDTSARPSPPTSASPSIAAAAGETDLGYSVGGAKDIETFRENIKNGYMPVPDDLTFEGLFYDYQFNTGDEEPCEALFCPSYGRAVTRDPLTGEEEYYLSVGLHSNIKASDFERPDTDIVIVLDISGSMGSPFNRYYYDSVEDSNRADEDARKTKLALAGEAISGLIDVLRPNDRLGIVLFSETATVAKPLRLLRNTDRQALKGHLSELQPTNSTNLSAGLTRGAEMLHEEESGRAKRLIVLTDAMPNQGAFGAGGLQGMLEQQAEQGVYATFIGVGIDFQSTLVEAMTKIRGANYLSIHSGSEFRKRLGEQFDYLITPLVYDLQLSLEGTEFAVQEMYGVPDKDLPNGELIHVRTLFPSPTTDEGARGGIILLKLKKNGYQSLLTLRASYEDTQGMPHENQTEVRFDGMTSDAFDDGGVRKGVLLARYGTLLREWLEEESRKQRPGTWERQSQPLTVSSAYQDRFMRFVDYFRKEAEAIGDAILGSETTILERLIRSSSSDVDGINAGDDWRY